MLVYPAAARPLDVRPSAIPRIIPSFMLLVKPYHELQPIGGTRKPLSSAATLVVQAAPSRAVRIAFVEERIGGLLRFVVGLSERLTFFDSRMISKRIIRKAMNIIKILLK
jgi:hypothetical protein